MAGDIQDKGTVGMIEAGNLLKIVHRTDKVRARGLHDKMLKWLPEGTYEKLATLTIAGGGPLPGHVRGRGRPRAGHLPGDLPDRLGA